MKIAVCVKQTIDVMFPIELDPNTHNLPDEDVSYTVNHADRCASELAITVKEKWGGEVIFISLGPPRVQQALQSCLAMGGDKAINIWDTCLEANPGTTAYILAKMIKILAPDLTICGNQSSDERCAEVPAAIAQLLDLPQVTGVLTLELSPNREKALVQRKLERGRRQSVECPLPAVIAVEPETVQPRYVSLRQLREAYSADISKVGSKELDLDVTQLQEISSQREVVSLSWPRPRPKQTFTFDGLRNLYT